MANPFTVNVPNALEALMIGEKSYDSARSGAARQQAQDALMQGDTRGALARLIGANDPRMMQALAQYQSTANGVFGTPIYGTDASGNTVLGAIDKQGGFRKIDTGGVTPTPGVRMIDTGTGFVPVQSRTGQPVQGAQYQPGQPAPAGAPQPQIGFIPKDVAGEASQKKFGTEQGEAQANLVAMRSKLPGLLEVVKKLGEIGDKAAYTTAGQLLDYGRTQAGLTPRDAAIARTTYIAMVDNQVLPLLRETFGAAFTQKEGDSLKVTLGDPNKTPQEKRAVLDAFIEQKVRNVSALERQLQPQGSPNPSVPQTPQRGAVMDGYRFKGGDPADQNNWVKLR